MHRCFFFIVRRIQPLWYSQPNVPRGHGVREQAVSNRPATDPRRQGKMEEAEPGEERHTEVNYKFEVARTAFIILSQQNPSFCLPGWVTPFCLPGCA